MIPEPPEQTRAPFPFSLSSSREDALSDNILDRGRAENPVEGIGRDATLAQLYVTYDDSPLSAWIGRLSTFQALGNAGMGTGYTWASNYLICFPLSRRAKEGTGTAWWFC